MFTEALHAESALFQSLSPLSSDEQYASPLSSAEPAPPAKPAKPQPKKKRKATYLLRKEKQASLQQEIERLESQVAVLKTRSLPPEEAAKADPVLQRREAENAVLTSVLRHQQLHVANAQSLLSRCLGAQHTHPLYTRIRLSKDWPERRATLRSVRAEKLRNAYEYIAARSSHAQPEKMQLSDERFESAQGDLCCVRFETVHFRGVESLEQVYNALVFYLTNMEISISERLGHITVRDDYDSIEGTAYNSRIASTEDCGVTTEMNAVSFPQLFAKDELGAGVGPCAVMASDCVDEDELYPYNPRERVRKDVSGAVVLTQEIERLESQVAVLKTRSLPPEEAAKADPVLQRREAENAALTSVLRHQQLHVANAQSLLSRCLGDQHTHPLYTRIRLSKDWPERRATLRSVRAEKLRNAYEYIAARSSHAQPEKMQLSDERFESAQGDLCCVRFETVHFRGVESLEQVYNALVFYLTNMEISISERLGHITVRDDYDSIEGTAYNSRIASTEDCGVTTEMNAVSFPQLFAKDELGAGVGPCAVMASDCVDEDELYPYNPRERVRKDVSGAVVLTQEIERLESQVAVLKTRSLPPEEAAKADPVLQRREAENAALTSVLRHQQLHVANAQSLLSRCLGAQHTHPLYTRIRLSKDWPERRATLRSVRAEKLRNAYEYIAARSSHAQPEKMQLSDERFESAQGDLCCVRFETVHFRGVESLEQVYNALVFYLTNMEISISERLGHITVRDDYDSIEGTAYNSRIASTEDCGVTTEMNAVSFPQLFAKDELGAGVGPCAVMASDCVDEDELYPYNPRERVRKDVSGAVVLTCF
ncbi:uncharacterized protein IUM83_14756 [Phytophthora cinnamomi]|uniref:uncharacterized protein n=1 Tax=Phytophthora cinnamomi TaxID=4785 RepID=UPI003559BDC0|nr:hypothetical protein IUM83_14756 [Phytophthora cinnamomi]